MKAFIACLLFGMIVPLSFAQQNQNLPKPDSEIDTLKNRISILENQLQAVENVEKMELAAKLADANAKLRNAEIDKYTRGLKDTNNEWLRTWSLWFVGILGFLVVVIGGAFWSWLRSRADRLIEDSVERSLSGFKEALAQVETLKNELKEAVGQVNILKDQIRILEKEHTASVLESSVHLPDTEGRLYSETVKVLPDGGLLDLIADKTRGLDFKYKAAEVLFVRKNPKLVSPLLKLLNSVVDSEVNWDDSDDLEWRSRRLINFLGQLHTQETYEGLTKFLNRLLTEDTKYKDLFLTQTVFLLVDIRVKLGIRDSISILRTAIPDLEPSLLEYEALGKLAEYFHTFNEPEGIKEILTNGLTDEMPDVETQCLELLQKHDPDFVEDWKAQKEATNTETEESS
jgi:polyhydroxyalkanoate synthesis regulator phasin